tara:strand:- start:1097 stop:3073 length:1977 start_codon:yes stop_codon:yes gene_type:complete
MAEKVKIELEIDKGKAASVIDLVNDKVQDLGKAAEKTGKELNEAPKKGVTAFGKFKKSVKGALPALKNLAKIGVKGLLTSLKGLAIGGLGLIVSAFGVLLEGLRNNQEVMDSMAVVLKTVQGVAAQAARIFVDMFKSVNEATGGFDALQKVLGGSLTISINVVLGAIQAMMLGLKHAQFAWEMSFFGDKDPETIIRLGKEINELEAKLDKTGDSISGAGKQIADNFGEAVGEVGQLATGIAESSQKAIDEVDVKAAKSRAKRIVELENESKIAIAENDKLQFQYQRDAELQRQIRDDLTAGLKERTAANDELLIVLQKQEKLQKANAQIQVDLATERLAADESSIENKVALIEAEKVYADVLENITGFMSEQKINREGLQMEELDLIKSQTEAQNARMIIQRENAAELETDSTRRIDMLINAAELERTIEEKRLQENIESYQKGTQAKSDAEQAFEDFKVESNNKLNLLDVEKSENDLLLEEQKKAALYSTLDSAISIAGEESKIGKALFILKTGFIIKEQIMAAQATMQKILNKAAEATVDGSTGFMKAAASAPPPANIPLIAIFAAQAAGIAMSIRSAVKAAKGIVGSKGGGGGGGGVTVPSAPPAFNIVGANPQNQLAETLSGESQTPIKAYVTSGDVTTAQSLERNIIENASIG